MALEDLAAMRAVHGSTVLYPCDGNAAARLTETMADTKGIVFMRTTRGGYPVIYGPSEEFQVGGSKVIRSSTDDRVTLIGAGVTVYQCLEAADELQKDGIEARVIDLYSVKPVDEPTLRQAARETGGFVVAEDHYPEGGLAAAVLEALADEPPRLAHCAVRGLPGSGTPAELMDAAGISAKQIAKQARRLAQDKEKR
jgi:transketolase